MSNNLNRIAPEFLERRRHERVEVAEAIFVEVVGRGQYRKADNPVLRCETVDVSVGGLKLHVHERIEDGSQLNLAVPFGDWTDNLELVGVAKWCRQAANRIGYWVGLELEDASREDMVRWARVVRQLQRK